MHDLRKIGLSKEKPNFDSIAAGEVLPTVAGSADTDINIEEVANQYQADLYHVFQHYGSDYARKGMSMDEFLFMAQDLSLVDSDTLSLSTVVRICMHYLMFVGDVDRENITFPHFIGIISKCCDVKYFDGCTPLHQVRTTHAEIALSPRFL
jgi:hypothetical protein